MDEAFFGQTMKAYWEEGADLGDMAVLESIAKSSGLDWEVLQPRLESGHYREQVLAQHRRGRQFGHSRNTRLPHRQPPVHRRPALRGLQKGHRPRAGRSSLTGNPAVPMIQLKTQTGPAPSIPISAPSTTCPTKAGSKSLSPSSTTSDGQVPSFSSTASTSPLPIGKTVDPFSLPGTPRSQ